MSRPAFRTTYYQNYPPPFYPGMSGQWPVPGWGVRPVMAGPERVGVGAVAASSSPGSAMRVSPQMLQMSRVVGEPEPPPAKKPFPWVWIFTAAGLLGGGLALAYNYKLIGKRR